MPSSRPTPSPSVIASPSGNTRGSTPAEARFLTVAAAAIPLGEPAARRRAEDNHAHDWKLKRPGSSPGPSISRINLVQALPAYAPTSIPSSTTSNSGLVHFILTPPETLVVHHSR